MVTGVPGERYGSLLLMPCQLVGRQQLNLFHGRSLLLRGQVPEAGCVPGEPPVRVTGISQHCSAAGSSPAG